VLILLLTTILAAGGKRKALLAGLAFTASMYISYFLMGLGLFSALRASGLTHTFFTVVAVLAIVVGLFNLKDYLWYGKWFIMEVPLSWRPKMKMLVKSVTSVPGAFLVGFVVSLFLLPCTSGPYIVILGLLAQTATKGYAIGLLLLYNLIFILPLLAITLSIYFGFTTTEKAEEWRTRKLKTLHLIAGAIMVLIGIAMFVAMWLGYV
jgi:cytochrome c biogenesis protein CcdA